ncbi:MAG: 4'-phosphopantetheinyl transferase superfamily protein, partial [Thiomonas sp.]
AVHRRRFIAAHAWMRRILGLYLRQPPQTLRWAAGPLGKPELAGAAPVPQLRFNLSHSQDMALLGVSRTAAVGIDIEAIRPGLADAALLCAVLTTSEREALLRLPASEHDTVFCGCWTRKEAWLKALGLGLSIEPGALHVGLAATCQRVAWPGLPDVLTLTPLPAPAGHAAALAVQGRLRHVVQYDTTGLTQVQP